MVDSVSTVLQLLIWFVLCGTSKLYTLKIAWHIYVLV